MGSKKGKQTIVYDSRPKILGAWSIAGVKEGEGPLRAWFDQILTDDSYGEKTWEKSETKMLKEAVSQATMLAGLTVSDLDALLSGDLINQLMSSTFMARDLGVPFLGLYGACSTMTESLLLGSMVVDGGFGNRVAVCASSHYSTAERQFRLPLEHGNQRPPSAQWTVTGAGAMIVGKEDLPRAEPVITVDCATIGRIIDTGIKDVNQMGAAMAPAAVDTIATHLADTGRTPDHYDAILTGDLASIGSRIAREMLGEKGYPMDRRYDDCGCMIFVSSQDTHAGGSGCGCSGSVFAGRVYKALRSGELKRVLLISTGALLSTISPQQGESIPGIAHAVALTTEG